MGQNYWKLKIGRPACELRTKSRLRQQLSCFSWIVSVRPGKWYDSISVTRRTPSKSFQIHYSSYCHMLYSTDTDSIVKQTTKNENLSTMKQKCWSLKCSGTTSDGKNKKKFWLQLFAYFTLIRHGPHRKRRFQQFFVAGGTSLPRCTLATIGEYTDPQILLS
jgi:hypothetical protein